MRNALCSLFLVLLLYPEVAWSQKKEKPDLYGIRNSVLNYYVGNAFEIVADEYSFFTSGNMVLRNDDQYSVISQYSANPIIPNGKFIFENPLKSNYPYQPIHFKHWMTKVRSPETGLFGFIDKYGNEIIPLVYNEVTPVSILQDYSQVAFSIGTVYTERGEKEYYFISPFLENKVFLMKNKEIGQQLAYRKDYRYFIYRNKITNDGITRHINLFGDTVSISRRKKEYVGGGLYKVDSSFNGLKKMELIDYKDSVIAPFQFSDKFSMTKFQPIGGDKYVSFLTGRDGIFDFALMNEKGEIYSRLKSGEGNLTNFSINHGGENIIGYHILLYATDKNGKSNVCLWDIRGEKKIKKVEDIFLEANAKNMGIGYSDVLQYYFSFISLHERYIKFELTLIYKPIPELMAFMPWGIKNYSSGVGGGQLINFKVEGIGLMNLDEGYVGKLIYQPIYQSITGYDDISRIALAEVNIEGKLYKGFIESVADTTGNGTGPFRILVGN